MQLVAYSTSTSQTLDPSSSLSSQSNGSTSGNSSRNSKHKNVLSMPAGGKGSAAFNSNTSKHKCWQPVLVGYGSDSSGQETTSSDREVVRGSPAAMSLWAIEAHGKDIAVLSDPACLLQLRCSFSAGNVVAISVLLFHDACITHVRTCAEPVHALQLHSWVLVHGMSATKYEEAPLAELVVAMFSPVLVAATLAKQMLQHMYLFNVSPNITVK